MKTKVGLLKIKNKANQVIIHNSISLLPFVTDVIQALLGQHEAAHHLVSSSNNYVVLAIVYKKTDEW